MIAVSADPITKGRQAALEMKLLYPILSDPNRALINSWGVLHPTEGIARPAMFLVNKTGKVVWRYVGMEASDRPPMALILKQLESVK